MKKYALLLSLTLTCFSPSVHATKQPPSGYLASFRNMAITIAVPTLTCMGFLARKQIFKACRVLAVHYQPRLNTAQISFMPLLKSHTHEKHNMRKFATVATLATTLCTLPLQATNEIEELYQWAGTKGGNFSFPDIDLTGDVDIKSIPKETTTYAQAQNPCALGVLYLHGVMVGAYDPQQHMAFVKTIYSQDELLELKKQLIKLTPGSQISIVEFPECIYGTGDIYNRSKANNEADRKFTASVLQEIKQNDQVELKFFYTSRGLLEGTLMVDARNGEYSMPRLRRIEKLDDYLDGLTPERKWEEIMRERNGYYEQSGEGAYRGVMSDGFDGPASEGK